MTTFQNLWHYNTKDLDNFNMHNFCSIYFCNILCIKGYVIVGNFSSLQFQSFNSRIFHNRVYHIVTFSFKLIDMALPFTLDKHKDMFFSKAKFYKMKGYLTWGKICSCLYFGDVFMISIHIYSSHTKTRGDNFCFVNVNSG